MLDPLLAIVGGTALVVGLFSRRIRDLPLSQPLVALAVGVVAGPVGLGLVEIPHHEHAHVVRTAAHLVLALSLIAAALRFPVPAYARRWRQLALLLTVVLVGMTAIGTGVAAVTLGVPLAGAALLGAAVAPTDPVLAASVVTGEGAEEQLPERTRLLLSGESAGNDALAFPFVTVAMAAVLGEAPGVPGAQALGPIGGTVLDTLVKVLVGVVAGVVIGAVTGKALHLAERRADVSHATFLVLAAALALFTLGTVRLLHGEGLVGVFVAGLAYNHQISRSERLSEFSVQEAVNDLLVLPVFVVLGVVLPWRAWEVAGWEVLAFPVAVLALRRLPLLLPLVRPLRITVAEGLFLGWFGPVGVAALFYLAHAVERGAADDVLWGAGTLTVVVSTVAHGLTSTPGRNAFARREPQLTPEGR